eukprot:XP_025985251.1 uncharacterized protein LOC106799694 [Glycine max]
MTEGVGFQGENAIATGGKAQPAIASGGKAGERDDDDDDDDDDYLASNSYVEESFDEDDSDDGISHTDDEVTDIVEPVSIVHPSEGVPEIQNPFWNDASHYNNINWSHPDEEDICGLDMPTTFNVGQELYVGMDFDSKDAVKNALKQYVMKVHQSFKVVETKSHKYIVCCPNSTEESPCPFYMRGESRTSSIS